MMSDLDPRTAPARDGRRLAWYFGGLLVVYVAAIIAFWPRNGGTPGDTVFLFAMFAPTVGAVLAWRFGPGSIQWGRPSWWILAGFVPSLAVLGVFLAGAGFGWYAVDSSILGKALTGAAVSTFTSSLSAAGEEIGWRGFLWPLLRTRTSFLRASLIIGAIWWIYHVPFVLFGWYGSIGGLPAFTVALVGATLFIGVLTDRSRSVWPSVVTHGAWNALVATSFAVEISGTEVPAFAGNDALLGEFGWLAAVTVLIVGVAAAWWHLRDLPDTVA